MRVGGRGFGQRRSGQTCSTVHPCAQRVGSKVAWSVLHLTHLLNFNFRNDICCL